MNVLLINPWLTIRENLRFYPVEPLGLCYLATYSNKLVEEKSYNINIRIIDAQLEGPSSAIKVKRGFRSGMDNASLIGFLKSYKPEIIGITNNYTPHTNDVLEICEIIKEILPEAKVILGGVNATLAHKELIVKSAIDIIIRNEGEDTFWDLLGSVYEKKNLYNIKGTTTKDSCGQVIINPDREFIYNLDDIPIPDRSLLNYKKYIVNDKLYFTTKSKPVSTIISSRGCTFNCIFCSTKTMWRQKWRARSPENVVDEIEGLVNTFGIREIAFQDDQFALDNQRVVNICREIRKRNLKVSFIVPSGITPALLKKETLEEMIKSGFYRIALSIDSGTERSKKFINKPLDLGKMRNLVKFLNSKGVWTYATFVIGFPDETKEDIQSAIDFAYSLKVDFLRFYIAQPYLGSRLYDIYLENGYIKNNNLDTMWEDFSVYDSFQGTNFLSQKELCDIRNSAENSYLIRKLQYMLNPEYFFHEFMPKINSGGKFIYFLRLLSQIWHLDKARGFTFQNKKNK